MGYGRVWLSELWLKMALTVHYKHRVNVAATFLLLCSSQADTKHCSKEHDNTVDLNRHATGASGGTAGCAGAEGAAGVARRSNWS